MPLSALDHAILLAHVSLQRFLREVSQVTAKRRIARICNCHVHHSGSVLGYQLSDYRFLDAMHLHGVRLLPAKNRFQPRAHCQSGSDFCERVCPQLFRHLKNKYASRFQHPDKFGKVFMAAWPCNVLQHKAGINEAKIIVRQTLQPDIFVQQEIAVRKMMIELLRQADHRRRNVHAAHSGKYCASARVRRPMPQPKSRAGDV